MCITLERINEDVNVWIKRMYDTEREVKEAYIRCGRMVRCYDSGDAYIFILVNGLSYQVWVHDSVDKILEIIDRASDKVEPLELIAWLKTSIDLGMSIEVISSIVGENETPLGNTKEPSLMITISAYTDEYATVYNRLIKKGYRLRSTPKCGHMLVNNDEYILLFIDYNNTVCSATGFVSTNSHITIMFLHSLMPIHIAISLYKWLVETNTSYRGEGKLIIMGIKNANDAVKYLNAITHPLENIEYSVLSVYDTESDTECVIDVKRNSANYVTGNTSKPTTELTESINYILNTEVDRNSLTINVLKECEILPLLREVSCYTVCPIKDSNSDKASHLIVGKNPINDKYQSGIRTGRIMPDTTESLNADSPNETKTIRVNVKTKEVDAHGFVSMLYNHKCHISHVEIVDEENSIVSISGGSNIDIYTSAFLLNSTKSVSKVAVV